MEIGNEWVVKSVIGVVKWGSDQLKLKKKE
jgi:hypothetical protein